jgi:uncharacterized protein
MKYLLLGLIRVYQWTISPLIGPVCRFYPSCSRYGYEAIARHGAIYGSYLTARRLLRCHPWNPGGVDLVPEKGDRPWWSPRPGSGAPAGEPVGGPAGAPYGEPKPPPRPLAPFARPSTSPRREHDVEHP